jgi:hypothetical protein
MWVLIFTALIAATAAAKYAHAHDFTFSWDDPVKRTDGSTLNPNTEIKFYQLRCQGPENVARFVDRQVTTALNSGQRQYRWVNAVVTDGWYTCQMTAVDTGDRESPWSNEATVLKVDQPAPPTDFRRLPETTVSGSVG